jgi:hypothetical protein
MNDNAMIMSESDAVMVSDAEKSYVEERNKETFVSVLVMRHRCVELSSHSTEDQARSELASAAEINGVVGFVAQTTTRIVPVKPVAPKSFGAEITIDDEKILNALETGGWSYWGFFVSRHMMWSELINDGKTVCIGTADGDEITVGRDAIQRGLLAMIADQPERLPEIMHDECDSETCDVLVQYACFGEVRYA